MKPFSNSAAQIKAAAAAGIFSHLVNAAGFFDKVVVNVWGRRRKETGKVISFTGNLAIGGAGRFYGRCARGRHRTTGNGMQFKYGVLRKYENLSPFVVTIWAEGTPVTCADVLLVLDAFMCSGYRARVSAAELTFDLVGVPLWRLQRCLCARSRASEEISDRRGRVTQYVGTSRSPWQARLYRKTGSIVRVEFVLRSAFLRANDISSPQQLYFLKEVDLWGKLSFREVESYPVCAMPLRIAAPWVRRGLAVPPYLPASIITRELRESNVNPKPYLRPAACELVLRRMQKNLIW